MSRLPQPGRGSRKLVFHDTTYATEAYVLTPRYAPRRSGQCYRCHPHHCLPVSRPLPAALPPASAAAAAGPPPCLRCCRAFFVAQPLPATAAAAPSVVDLQAFSCCRRPLSIGCCCCLHRQHAAAPAALRCRRMLLQMPPRHCRCRPALLMRTGAAVSGANAANAAVCLRCRLRRCCRWCCRCVPVAAAAAAPPPPLLSP